jgi:hypothetical protein
VGFPGVACGDVMNVEGLDGGGGEEEGDDKCDVLVS